MGIDVEQVRADISRAEKQGFVNARSTSATVIRDVRLMLSALWLGGAVYFSAVVAPTVFGVLRAREVIYANEVAGSIVTRSLTVVNTAGCAIALLLLVSALLFRRETSRRAFVLEVISAIIVALATGIGQWVIAARMIALRAAMGRPIDDVAMDDPLRVSFTTLHGYSVTALCLAMVAGATLVLLIARRGRGADVRC